MNKSQARVTYIEVPQFAAALPMIILSDTPAILSFFPKAAASNKWSVVFSKEASIRTLSFIFATPKRVIPRTSPYVNEELAKKIVITSHSYLVTHNIAK
jgi:hypothetical protein